MVLGYLENKEINEEIFARKGKAELI